MVFDLTGLTSWCFWLDDTSFAYKMFLTMMLFHLSVFIEQFALDAFGDHGFEGVVGWRR